MATDLRDLVEMEKAVNEAQIIFGVGHGTQRLLRMSTRGGRCRLA